MISKILKKNVGLLALCLSMGMGLFAAGEETQPVREKDSISVSMNNEKMRQSLVYAAYASAIVTGIFINSVSGDCKLISHALMIAAYQYPTIEFEMMTKKYEEALNKYNLAEPNLEIKQKSEEDLMVATLAYKECEDRNYEGVYAAHFKLIGVHILGVVFREFFLAAQNYLIPVHGSIARS